MTLPAFKHLALLASAALVVSCATTSGNLKSKEDLAIAAGFKPITPTKPDQKAILAKLPDEKVTHITYKGKSYYVLPDKADGKAYVGGPKQFQSYQQLGQAKEQALEYDKDVNRYGKDRDPHQPSGAAQLATWDGWSTTDSWSATDGQTD